MRLRIPNTRQCRKHQQHNHQPGDGKARRNRFLRRRMLRVVSLVRNLVAAPAGFWFGLDSLLIKLTPKYVQKAVDASRTRQTSRPAFRAA